MGRSPVVAAALAMVISSAEGRARESLRRVDAPEIKELVREQRGRVVLLNFWATWCPPCLVEFPEIVAVEKAYRDRGLTVISVSADSPERIDSDLLPFLDSHPPDFPVYIMQTDDVDEFVRLIDPEWTGAIPATFFINRSGEVARKQFSVMSREEMERALEVVFEEPKP